MKTRYVVIETTPTDMYCLGVYDSFESAVGKAYLEALDFIDSTLKDESYQLHEMEQLDAENGYVIVVDWAGDLSFHREYYILENNEE